MTIDRIRELSKLYARGFNPSQLKKDGTERATIGYKVYMQSLAWQAFRARVFAERGRQCEDCLCTKGIMHLHHLHYDSFGHEHPTDVRILCIDCHGMKHGRKLPRVTNPTRSYPGKARA